MDSIIIRDMPNAEYHSNPAISSSMLKTLNKSPRHCYAKHIDPQREATQPTPAMQLGTCFHVMLLEPHRENEVLTVVPEGVDRRSKAGKEFFAELESSGKISVKHEDYARLKGMVESALGNNEIVKILTHPGAIFEGSIFYTDPDTGAKCKIRPDLCILPCADFPNGLIVDLKSAADASINEFQHSAYRLGYHIQAGWYAWVFMNAIGTDALPEFRFIAVEKEAPFCVAWLDADCEEFVSIGMTHALSLYEKITACMKDGSWPGYPESLQKLSLPAHVLKQFEGEEVEVGYV